jgi:hypothetical protein
MSQEELRLANCQGKAPLTEKVAKQLKVRYAKKGRPSTPYKCRFCGKWHMGTPNILKGGHLS